MNRTTADTSEFTEHRIQRGAHALYARHYAGTPPAFVLMHGFPDNLRIYDALAPLLAAAGRSVVAFDFLSYGGSDKPVDHRYTSAGLEDDLQAVVAALGLGPVVPVAHMPPARRRSTGRSRTPSGLPRSRCSTPITMLPSHCASPSG